MYYVAYSLPLPRRATEGSRCATGPFQRSVVLLCGHSLLSGTYGLVINRLMDSQHHPGAAVRSDTRSANGAGARGAP